MNLKKKYQKSNVWHRRVRQARDKWQDKLLSNTEHGAHGRKLMVYEITKYINKSQTVFQNFRKYWMNNVKNIKKLMAYYKEKERDKKAVWSLYRRGNVPHYLEMISEGLTLTEGCKAFWLKEITSELNKHGGLLRTFWLRKCASIY
jgi:hypothetical protein